MKAFVNMSSKNLYWTKNDTFTNTIIKIQNAYIWTISSRFIMFISKFCCFSQKAWFYVSNGHILWTYFGNDFWNVFYILCMFNGVVWHMIILNLKCKHHNRKKNDTCTCIFSDDSYVSKIPPVRKRFTACIIRKIWDSKRMVGVKVLND